MTPNQRDGPRHARARGRRHWPLRVLLLGAAVIAGVLVGVLGSPSHGIGHAKQRRDTQTAIAVRSFVASPSVPTHFRLVFDGVFSGSALNTSVWSTCYPSFNAATGCTNFGNHQEVEWYLPSQVSISHGVLHLTAIPRATAGSSVSGSAETYPYRSGMVTTYSSFHFTYGFVQVVARVPRGAQFWPALWMLPVDGSSLPEIDILELASADSSSAGIFFHPSVGAPVGYVVPTKDLSVGWHTFTLNWEPGVLTWYVDGQAVFSDTTDVPDEPMYILANLAATNYVPTCLSNAPVTCTGSFDIQSIRVWQDAS